MILISTLSSIDLSETLVFLLPFQPLFLVVLVLHFQILPQLGSILLLFPHFLKPLLEGERLLLARVVSVRLGRNLFNFISTDPDELEVLLLLLKLLVSRS